MSWNWNEDMKYIQSNARTSQTCGVGGGEGVEGKGWRGSEEENGLKGRTLVAYNILSWNVALVDQFRNLTVEQTDGMELTNASTIHNIMVGRI